MEDKAYVNFGSQTRCIMGDVQMTNRPEFSFVCPVARPLNRSEAVSDLALLQTFLFLHVHELVSIRITRLQWRIQGRGSGARAPLLFLAQSEARKAEKKIFLETAPPPYLRVWMNGLPLI